MKELRNADFWKMGADGLARYVGYTSEEELFENEEDLRNDDGEPYVTRLQLFDHNESAPDGEGGWFEYAVESVSNIAWPLTERELAEFASDFPSTLDPRLAGPDTPPGGYCSPY